MSLWGGYDSSQIADLVGLYILHILNRIISSDQVGLYRDDGIMNIPNSNGPNSSSIQKKIIRALGFKIEISSNNKIVNFLDVTLDLSNNIYKPFIKMDQSPSYININSNHPKAIIKQVPKAVNLRIRNLSTNEKIFRKGNKMYIDALKSSGYKENFTYKEEKMPNDNNKEINKENRRKNKKRKIIWFNPPFCRLANINIGKYFLKLVDKHFKHGNKLHKIFNRKTLKISYSCMKNIFQIINSHNKNITKNFQDQINNRNNNNNNNNNNNCVKKECNCKSRDNCPMNGLCNLNNVIYQAIIYPKENITVKKTYIRLTSTKWKERYSNHKFTFSHEHLKHHTALLKQFWWLKNKGLTPEIEWSILKKSNTPNSFEGRCNLCLEEKIHIMTYKLPEELLNKRSELIARCRHRTKFKL